MEMIYFIVISLTMVYPNKLLLVKYVNKRMDLLANTFSQNPFRVLSYILHLVSILLFGKHLELSCLFLVTDGFCWFWMESFHKNIHSMLEFLVAPFLDLHFSYYTLINFLIMLFVILLSILMILLSTLSVIRHLICGSNRNWLLNLNLI